jgi:hypothetical protein
MKVVLNRQKAGLEDLTFGVGTETQIRNGQEVIVTKINAANLPFDETRTLLEAIEPFEEAVIPNLPEILDAANQAAIATTKAQEASVSAAAALVSELSAASLLDQFDDRYLGSKSTPPTTDNDDGTLLVGALYWDTVDNRIMVWDGAAWSDALTLTESSISTLTNKTLNSSTNTVGADHVHYKVRNASGATINAGTIVTASGTQPGTDYIQIVPVTNALTQVALGIVQSTILNNGIGLVINTGVKEDFNTSAWTVGTILYPNNSGSLTNAKPTSGQYQACAVVLRQHSSAGTLLVEFTEPKAIASTTQSGYVQLNNTLTSTSTTQALTAAQGKVLEDGKVAKTTVVTTAITSVTFNADGTLTIVTP